MNTLTHKLIRVSLVNWYLFQADDIHIDGESIMLTGGNGAGKSSILDAIQTILGGGNESKLMFNAASSDGNQSGRTIRSYVLGEVVESTGEELSGRSTSNCYISMSFQGRNGSYYSFGCAFYASKSDNRLDKYFFQIDGYDLSHLDYMQDEHNILTFKQFEVRLRALDGQSKVYTTATEYSEGVCELMSATGSEGAISPESLFRTIRQGLTFKQHKNVTEFTRSHILPDKTLDVTRIENDFREYQRIQQLIKHAKERLEGFQQVIKFLNTYRNSRQAAECYRWVNTEARVSALDLDKEAIQEKLETLNQKYNDLKDKLHLYNGLTEELTKKRDTANLALQGSDNQQRLNELEQELKNCKTEISNYKEVFEGLRKSLIRIESVNLSVIDTVVCDNLKPSINTLSSITDFDGEDLSSQWPRSQNNLADSLQAAFKLKPVLSDLRSHVNLLERQVEGINDEIQELTDVARELSSGKASLKRETLSLIDTLKQHGLTVKPICDLAEITDSNWQWAIEGFLGVWNREALIVLDDDGKPASNDDLDRSLALYRHEKKLNARLRSVKILNPNKIRAPSRSPQPGSAAALVQSDNPVVANYLCRLLGGVDLVQTEEELRSRERAITPDGMIAANGAISGGQRIDFVLFGEQARKDQAQMLHQQLKDKMQSRQKLQQKFESQEGEYRALEKALSDLTEQGQKALDMDYYGLLAQAEDHHPTLECQIAELSQSQEFAQLQENFNKADNDKKKNDQAIRECSEQSGKIKQKIDTLGSAIPDLENKIQEASAQRRQTESSLLFDQAKASGILEKLQGDHSENYTDIQSIANSKARTKDSQASKSKEEGNKALIELCHTHDIEGKAELISMDPLDCLKECENHAEVIENSELQLYDVDAQNACDEMLGHFRRSVAIELRSNIDNLKTTFKTLNRSLQNLCFNNTRYEFTYKLVELESLREVYEYVKDSEEGEADGGLFDTRQDHPGLMVIEKLITDGRLHEISDYRNFYSYDIKTIDIETGKSRLFSQLLRVGSGGEKQTPFYVALGASFMNAFRLQKLGDKAVSGGAGFAIFDEAMSKMDGVNTASALKFFRSIGLQVILAAPPDASVKISTHVDKTVSVIRSGSNLYLDQYIPTDAGRELLESDNPHVNPEITEPFYEQAKKEFGFEQPV
ncbi:SbcC/MukB-like Walker B domain-containing protein [Endozoicomonas sp. ALD040]|uniref:SbcC/MukB-like Walker B domain-containing protein n=1 Tax=Endozoicomonas sp. ALD040 TaxID=3403079 RepID=UPI003BB1480A